VEKYLVLGFSLIHFTRYTLENNEAKDVERFILINNMEDHDCEMMWNTVDDFCKPVYSFFVCGIIVIE
jgi:hypothetical protein